MEDGLHVTASGQAGTSGSEPLALPVPLQPMRGIARPPSGEERWRVKTSETAKRLKHYRAKRDFLRTPEPAPDAVAPAGDAPVFVVHKHDATRLHYDLRLEIGGVLVSWGQGAR